MEYQGYVGVVQYDPEDRIFHGRLAGLRDVVSFEGASVEEIERAFRAAVDDYLAFCSEQGRAPQQPFSGKFVLRTTPDVHRAATRAAAAEGKSLNAWAAEALARAAGVRAA
jgi:predicted HicB family RNase H-like nuclease